MNEKVMTDERETLSDNAEQIPPLQPPAFPHSQPWARYHATVSAKRASKDAPGS